MSPSRSSITRPRAAAPSLAAAAGRLRIGFAVAMAAVLFSAALGSAVDLFVATNGSDTVHDGRSPETPFRTIQHAYDSAVAGDRIVIRGGVYREQITATSHYGAAGQPITFCAYSNETPMIKASDVVTGWQSESGAVWRRSNWAPDPQQVFDDGVPLRRIGRLNAWMADEFYTPFGTNRADLAPGSFFYEGTTSNLYVWLADGSSPAGSLMEASVRTFCFYTVSTNQNAWFHLKGLSFRHGNTCTVTNGWPTVFIGGHTVVEDCDIQWADFAAISLGPHARVLRCNFSNSGNNGIGAQADFLIQGCTIMSNNYLRFNTGWHAGGIKIIPDHWGTVEDCEVAWNQGPGIWFDYCRTNLPVIIRRNYVHHNRGTGIFIEVTRNAQVYNNLLVANYPRSIHLSSAWQNRVYNNTIVDNSGWMAVELSFAPNRTNALGQTLPLSSNAFFNNIIYGTHELSDLAMQQEDGSNVFANVIDYNCYWRTSGPSRARITLNRPAGGIFFTNLADWTRSTGFDRHSLVMDPLFYSTRYHLKSRAGSWDHGVFVAADEDSPCLDAGDPHADFTNEPGWNGGRVNMGWEGNTSEASLSPDSDGDGLSDPLERHLLRTDPERRYSDGDEADDFSEYVAGTDPNDAGVFFALTSSNPAPAGVSGFPIAWYGRMERSYRVLSAASLPADEWAALTGLVDEAGQPCPAPEGRDRWIYLWDPAEEQTQRHYRVTVRWP